MSSNETALEPGKTQVFYIRNEKRFPIACVAYKNFGHGVGYAVSVHNPKDTFNRSLGRSIAVGRLEYSQDPTYTGVVKETNKLLVEAAILGKIENQVTIPAKVRTQASRLVTEFNHSIS